MPLSPGTKLHQYEVVLGLRTHMLLYMQCMLSGLPRVSLLT